MLLHKAEHLYEKYIKNQYLRIGLAACVLVVLSLALGTQEYLGSGMGIIEHIFHEGETAPLAFLLKMLFTAVTLAAGFKGGEIVPTFCIGATFGCVVGGLLGLDAGICGALGLIGLFCCATNSPLASIVLSIEMFGGANLYVFALVCVICFVLSGNSGLYASQIIQFDKASTIQSARES